jgi:hypothetical protein
LEEKWAEVEGFPGYIVSNYGVIVSLKTDRQLIPRPNEDGYLRVALYVEGRRTDVYVHQIVAQAFFGDFRPGMHIRHVNGNLRNNQTRNLALKKLDPRERRANAGESWGRRVIIKETGQVFRTVRDCANYIGGNYGDVYKCLRGERKSHVGYSFAYYDGGN